MRQACHVALAFLVLSFLSCSSDTRTYLRKGGHHLSLSDGSHELLWFSGIHSNDPKNIMFADIEKEFARFNPNLVLVEGGQDKNAKQTRNEAILQGESSFTAFLAHKNTIECMSLEPPDSYLGSRLVKTYPRNDILAMIIIREIHQWQREYKHRSMDFMDMVVQFVGSSAESMFGTLDFEADRDFIQNITEPYIGFRVSNENWLRVPAFSLVYNAGSKIHAIWADTIALRNAYLLELLAEKKKTYTKIFVIMGFDHAQETMEDLKALYKN